MIVVVMVYALKMDYVDVMVDIMVNIVKILNNAWTTVLLKIMEYVKKKVVDAI